MGDLRTRNATQATWTVSVQYRTPSDDTFTWLPADLADAKEALTFEVPAGTRLDLEDDGDPLKSSRVCL